MLTTYEGKGDEYQENIKELAVKVRKDPGTIRYVVHRLIDDPSKFFVYEQYENEEAVKLHGSTPHFKEYRKLTANVIKEREVFRMNILE